MNTFGMEEATASQTQRSAASLTNAITTEWEQIPADGFQNFIESLLGGEEAVVACSISSHCFRMTLLH